MTWQELPKKLRLYIATAAVLAIPIILWTLWDLVWNPHHPGWVVLAILAALTVPFFLLLPSVNTMVGIGDAYIMAIAMIYGPSPCIMATLCHSLAASIVILRPKVYLYRVFFNVSSTVCIAWIYSNAYKLINPSRSTKVDDLLIPAV